MTALLIVLSGYMDRIRGDGFGVSKGFDLALYGWVIAALLGHAGDIYTLPFVLAFAAGGSPGWPLHYVYNEDKPVDEWWAVGPLVDNVLLAVFARGAIWALPMALMYPLGQEFGWAAVSMFVAFPLSQIAVRRMMSLNNDRINDAVDKYADGWWGAMEWIRGLMLGGLIALGV